MAEHQQRGDYLMGDRDGHILSLRVLLLKERETRAAF